jgi:4a-hydroxytetrahydrobiopterin dehydratase
LLDNLPGLLSPEEIDARYSMLNGWELVNHHHLIGIFKFNNFADAMEFTVKVGRLAEEMQHHPEITLEWGRVEILIFTHDRGGLTDWDFDFADRVNSL